MSDSATVAPRLSRKNARVLISGLIPQGFEAAALTPHGRQEVREALDTILALTESANVQLTQGESDASDS